MRRPCGRGGCGARCRRGGISAAARTQSGDNAVTAWNLIAPNTLVVFPLRAGGAPPMLQLNLQTPV